MQVDTTVFSGLAETGMDIPEYAGTRIDVAGVTADAAARVVLNDVSLSIAPGELVALVGGSGAGKTTLLEAMAGLRPVAAGVVAHDGAPVRADRRVAGIGFVPQDDIVHRELPLRRVLRYAARLRLPAGTSRAEVEQIVERVLCDLDIADRVDVRVGDLSGGQRKRASIAVELLTRPRVLFLDEPTSGLDPSTSTDVLGVLSRLTREGVTVVLTTHNPADIEACDRVVFLAPGGYLAFAGTPRAAWDYFGVADLSLAYRRLSREESPAAWATRFAAQQATVEVPAAVVAAPYPLPAGIGPAANGRSSRSGAPRSSRATASRSRS